MTVSHNAIYGSWIAQTTLFLIHEDYVFSFWIQDFQEFIRIRSKTANMWWTDYTAYKPKAQPSCKLKYKPLHRQMRNDQNIENITHYLVCREEMLSTLREFDKNILIGVMTTAKKMVRCQAIEQIWL